MSTSSKERVGAMSKKHYLPSWAKKSRPADSGGVRTVVGGDLGAHKNAALLDHPDGSVTNAKLATDVKVGSLAALDTTDKSSVVAAINEILAAGGMILPYAATAAYTGPLVLLTNSQASEYAVGLWGVADYGLGVIGSGVIGVRGIATSGVGVDGTDSGNGVGLRGRAYTGVALRAHVELLDGTVSRSVEFCHFDGTLEKITEGPDVGGTVVRQLTAAAETLSVPRVQKDETVAPGATIATTTQIAKVTGAGVVTLPPMAGYPAHAILTVIDVSGTLGPGVTLTVAPTAGDAYLVAPGAIATPGGSVQQFHDGTFWYAL